MEISEKKRLKKEARAETLREGGEIRSLTSDDGHTRQFFLLEADSVALPEGGSLGVLSPSGAEIAVFRKGGRLYAIDNACAHKDAQLCLGDMEDIGACYNGAHADGSKIGGLCVRCPKHRKKFGGGLYFNLLDGQSFTKNFAVPGQYKAHFRVGTYAVRAGSEGQVWIACDADPRDATVDSSSSSDASAATASTAAAGDVAASAAAAAAAEVAAAAAAEWAEWRVVCVERDGDSPDTSIWSLRCAAPLPPPADLAPMWHVAVCMQAGSLDREYTPVSSLSAYMAGELELLVKIYPGGKFTKRFGKLVAGDTVWVGAPSTTLHVEEVGVPPLSRTAHGFWPLPLAAATATAVTATATTVTVDAVAPTGDAAASTAGISAAAAALVVTSATPDVGPPVAAAAAAATSAADVAAPVHVVLVAGGTGITPMRQLLEYTLALPVHERVHVHLLYSCRSPHDVLCAAWLRETQRARADTFSLSITLTGHTAASEGFSSGRIGASHVENDLKLVPRSSGVVVSGPKGFFEHVRAALVAGGFAADKCIELEA